MPEQATVLITLLFTGMIVILGLWGFFAPRSIGEFVRSWSTMGGMWLAVALRLGFATVLWFAAPLSRTEMVLKVLAGLVLASAAVLPINFNLAADRLVSKCQLLFLGPDHDAVADVMKRTLALRDLKFTRD